MDTKEQIARIIWKRFANSTVETWEDETHKAEYLDTAKEILWEIAPSCGDCNGRHRMDVPFALSRGFVCSECNPEFGNPSVYRTAPKPGPSPEYRALHDASDVRDA